MEKSAKFLTLQLDTQRVFSEKFLIMKVKFGEFLTFCSRLDFATYLNQKQNDTQIEYFVRNFFHRTESGKLIHQKVGNSYKK